MKKKLSGLILLLFFACTFFSQVFAVSNNQMAYSGKVEFEVRNAIFVGDRLIHIAHTLGVVSKAMVARGCKWKGAQQIPAKLLGCPNRVIIKDKAIIPETIKKMKIENIYIEKHQFSCLLKKEVAIQKVLSIAKRTKAKITIVDISDDFETSVKNVAKIFGKEKQAQKRLDKFNKELAFAEKRAKRIKKSKKVVVIKGFIKKKTGRIFLSIEAKGFQTDQYFLSHFGYNNIGNSLKDVTSKNEKDFFPVKDLSGLIKANPDVIVAYGEGVFESIVKLIQKHPEAKKITAIQNHTVFNLPYYIGSDVFNYPSYLIRWTHSLSLLK